jgi:hypothetical protein
MAGMAGMAGSAARMRSASGVAPDVMPTRKGARGVSECRTKSHFLTSASPRFLCLFLKARSDGCPSYREMSFELLLLPSYVSNERKNTRSM